MADRPAQFNSYPMIPNNSFGMNMLQQQQQQQQQMQQLLQQQQQHNALNQARGIPGVSNSENQQLWQHLSQQHRSQMGGMDSLGGQGMAQMAGINRNSFMNQMQGQGMQQDMPGSAAQLRQFPNLGAMNRPQQVGTRPGIPQQNFVNGNMNQQLMNNNPAMLQQALQPSSNNPFSRQLALLGNASQQLPQNGRLNLAAAFSQPNSQMNGHMGEMPGDGQGGQRMAPAMNGNGAQQPQQDQLSAFMTDKEGRRLTAEEVSYKIALMQRELESEQHKLESIGANPAEAHMVSQYKTIVARRSFLLQRVRERFASEYQHFGMNGQPSTPMNAPNHAGQQPSPAQRGSTPQQGWNTPVLNGVHAPQNNSMFPPGQSSGQANVQMPFNTPLAQGHVSAMPRNATPASQQGGPASFMNRPINSSPRPANGQQATVGSAAVPSAMQPAPSPSSRNIHPIDREKFNESLPQFLNRNGKSISEQRLALPSGGKIDLHALHTLVINQGGGPAVKSNDLWPIIAAKLGCPSNPGPNNSEPRAPPPYSDKVREVYDEYLQDFEKHYTMMVLDKLFRTNPLPQSGINLPQNHTPGQPPGAPNVANPQLPANRMDPKLVIAQLAQSNMTIEMMRLKRFPEPLLVQVDNFRRTAAAVRGFPGSNAPGGQALQSLPHGGELAGSSQMGGAPNASLRQMPGISPMISNQVAQGQNQSQQPHFHVQAHILSKTTPEKLQAAGMLVRRMREQANEERSKKQVATKHVPDSEKQQFNAAFETLLRFVNEVNNLLPTYHAITGDEASTRTMVQVHDMAMRQRQILSSPNPEYILDLMMVKRLIQMVVVFKSQLQALFQNDHRAGPQTGGPQPNPPQVPFGPPPSIGGPPSQGQNIIAPPQQPPTPQPNSSTGASSAPANTPANPLQNRSTPHLQPAPVSSKPKPQTPNPTAGPSSQVAPSPSALAVTPQTTSATSPASHASPQTPKSPKVRNPPKKSTAASKQRRPSKANNNSSTPAVDHTATPGSSAPTPATASSTPDSKENPLKRQREPEPSGQNTLEQPSTSSEDGPISKRLKGDWDDVPEPSIPKEEDAATFKTTDEVADLFTQVSEFMQSMPADMSNTFNQILKSAGSFTTFGDSSQTEENVASGSKSPKPAPQDEFTEYFDYSYFKDEETPDLTGNSSTSTGASPDSNPADNVVHPPPDSSKSSDFKLGGLAPDSFDPSHLGFLGEIDGGEAEYFTSRDGWRWDEPTLPSQDTPWAIST